MADDTLSVLNPITITDDMFISSTIAEDDYTAWSGATTYALGDRAINTTTHRIYESLQASNTNHDPTDITNTTGSAPWWLDVSPTNKWAMFDTQISTQSYADTSFTVVIQPGYFNSVYFAKLEADTIDVDILDAPGGSSIYSISYTLEGSAPADYYEYFYDRFKPLTDFLITDLLQYNDAEITVTFNTTAGDAKCGAMLLGDLVPLGTTLYGANAKPKTFSYIKIDEFGNNTIVRRKSAKDMTLDAYLDIEEATNVLEIITSLLDVPCLWIAANDINYAGLRVFGLGSAEMTFDDPLLANLNLNVQGLI